MAVQFVTQKSVQNGVVFMFSRPHSTHRGQLSTCPVFSLALGASTPPRELWTQSALEGLRRQSPLGGGHCVAACIVECGGGPARLRQGLVSPDARPGRG